MDEKLKFGARVDGQAHVSSTRKITIIGGTSTYFFMFKFWDASLQKLP